jgi:hypothetical protein
MDKVKNGKPGNPIYCRPKNRLYSIWTTMKQRCYNPKNVNYKLYGARGIIVCSEWRFSFRSFKTWAFQNGYDEKLTIDRINNDGNYEPDNCRWVTREENNKNKRPKITI